MQEHFYNFRDPNFRRSFWLTIGFLIVSLIINFYSGIYATEKASNAVTDIILSNTKVYNLEDVFVFGSWILVAFIIYLCTLKPAKMLFVVRAFQALNHCTTASKVRAMDWRYIKLPSV